jgi:hypothetical protein
LLLEDPAVVGFVGEVRERLEEEAEFLWGDAEGFKVRN